jgi:hypothetical protein
MGYDPAAMQAGMEALTKMFQPGTFHPAWNQSGLQDVMAQILRGANR